MRSRVAIVVGLLLACTATHVLMGHHHHSPWHEFLFKVTYVPIILAGLWFGLRGGLMTSAATSALYLLHVQFQLGGDLLGANLGRTLDLLLYNGIAGVTGVLSEAQLRARRRAERLAEEQRALRRQLEESYEALRAQTADLLETTEQLRQAERLATLGELTAGIAHEIRNPLSGLSGAAEILGRRDVTPETRAEFADILRKESARLNQVVQNILNLARVRPAECRETDVPEVVQRVAALVARNARQHGVSITAETAPGLRAQTDPMLLEHILLNLVLNAVQAMPGGGRVTVRGAAADGLLRLAVRDTGPGIAPADQARVFTPFYTTKPGGTGLGLAIARRLARGLGGEIRLTSTPGAGAEFALEIPLRAPAVPPRETFNGSHDEPEDPAGRGQ